MIGEFAEILEEFENIGEKPFFLSKLFKHERKFSKQLFLRFACDEFSWRLNKVYDRIVSSNCR